MFLGCFSPWVYYMFCFSMHLSALPYRWSPGGFGSATCLQIAGSRADDLRKSLLQGLSRRSSRPAVVGHPPVDPPVGVFFDCF